VLTAINGSGGANGLPDIPVNAIALDRRDPTVPGGTVLYVGTDIGVYRSTDGGANWQPFGVGFPHVAGFDMAITPPPTLLPIATHGRGMWEISLPSAGTETIGVYRPSSSTFYLRNTNTSGFADVQVTYGVSGDVSILGDWDGDGTATIGVYRNGIFYLRNTNT